MMYLLDTNVVSELKKAGSKKQTDAVIAWLDSVPVHQLYLSVITIMELELGILLVERRDKDQGAVLRSWFEGRVLPSFSGRILEVDFSIAKLCASLHVPNPLPERDAILAATAMTNGMTIVTRNIKDFNKVPVGLLNPWEFEIA